MPAVKKPKSNKIQKQASPVKKAEEVKSVISGQLKKKLPKNNTLQKERPKRGVVFIKHLPHGFFEEQLKKYFKQFGHVTRVRLARSERTGGSKGFAFVEFEHPEVAEIAANTMDNYLMFQKVVKAKYIPPEQQSFNYFKNTAKKVKNKAGKQIYVSRVTKATHNSIKKQNNWTESTSQKRTVAGLKKLNKLQQKYKHLDIDFSKMLVKPQKKSEESAAASSTSKSSITKKATKASKQEKAKLQIEDLLGNTINDDSDDEDYVHEDSEQEISIEDNSDLDKSLKMEDLLGKSIAEDSDDEDYKEEELVPSKKPKKRNTGVDLLKRKPGTGGVQKKKGAKTQTTVAAQKLKVSAAKKIAKPLQKVSKKLKK